MLAVDGTTNSATNGRTRRGTSRTTVNTADDGTRNRRDLTEQGGALLLRRRRRPEELPQTCNVGRIVVQVRLAPDGILVEPLPLGVELPLAQRFFFASDPAEDVPLPGRHGVVEPWNVPDSRLLPCLLLSIQVGQDGGG